MDAQLAPAEQPVWPVLGAKGADDAPLVPLRITTEMCNTTEDIDRNIEATLSRPYTPINSLLNAHEGRVTVVGSGPSLKDTYARIKGDIVACNNSFRFLLEKGIIPRYVFYWDADPVCEKFTIPHPDVTYLVASRSHPLVFKKLEGCKIYVLHAAGDLNIKRLLEKYNKHEPMVGGGTAAVTRSMCLVQPMGYRELHIHGGDSSYPRGELTHVHASIVPEKHLEITCNGRKFDTTPWLAQQAEDFKFLAPGLQSLGMKFYVHGDGLIPWIAKACGIHVDDESRFTQWRRDAARIARILWLNL